MTGDTSGGNRGHDPAEVHALSGRPVGELTLEAVRRGDIGLEDLRIHPETLERQAGIAEQHANPQLAELRRLRLVHACRRLVPVQPARLTFGSERTRRFVAPSSSACSSERSFRVPFASHRLTVSPGSSWRS